MAKNKVEILWSEKDDEGRIIKCEIACRCVDPKNSLLDASYPDPAWIMHLSRGKQHATCSGCGTNYHLNSEGALFIVVPEKPRWWKRLFAK